MHTIEIIQGDTSPIYKFQRKDVNDNVIKTLPQKMWATFKTDHKTDKALFQKCLNDGIEYSVDDYFYRFSIKPEDTANLCYGTYGFDIAIIDENGNKITLLNDGVLKILPHYTKKCNEV